MILLFFLLFTRFKRKQKQYLQSNENNVNFSSLTDHLLTFSIFYRLVELTRKMRRAKISVDNTRLNNIYIYTFFHSYKSSLNLPVDFPVFRQCPYNYDECATVNATDYLGEFRVALFPASLYFWKHLSSYKYVWRRHHAQYSKFKH